MRQAFQFLGLTTLGMLAACGDAPPQELAADPAAELAMARPTEVVVTTRDFGFDMPDTLTAGTVTLELVNDGTEIHHMALVRLDGGHTLEELMAAMQGQGPLPEWAVEVGGPNAAMPGAAANATLQLDPGTYVAFCVVPSPDGTPHLMKGMVKPFTVVASTDAAVALPAPTIIMTLMDYGFDTSTPITAGRQVIRFENVAEQVHEVLVVKLEPGKTAEDFLHFVEKMDGPPPGAVLGGIVGLSKGRVSQAEIEFVPGEYALICFIPDARDGRPHFQHGMVRQFTVS